jgi:Lrp/AsnC family transcriptional regulator, leucine-responsive regulatory protein
MEYLIKGPKALLQPNPKEKRVKRLRSEISSVDRIDVTILKALARDARISTADLAREVGLSSPSVAERVKRLEECGVIRGYTVEVAPVALGHALSAHIRIRPMPGQLTKLAALLDQLDAIVECDRVTGDDCFVAKAHVSSVTELEKLIDQILPLGSTNTAIIQSSPVVRRLPAMPRTE